MKASILIVDDERNVIKSLMRCLAEENYEVVTASSGEEGLQIMETESIKVAISDEMMPGMSGIEFLSIVQKRYPECVRIILTGNASLEKAMTAINNGEIYRFFTKPWQDAELVMTLRGAIEKYDLEAENRKLLKTIRRKAGELKSLEERYPGITDMTRDDKGNVVLEKVSEEELASIIADCEDICS